MATIDVASLAVQLKKLTKDDLINIIISGQVSQSTALSDQTVNQLESLLKCRGKVTEIDNGDFENYHQTGVVDATGVANGEPFKLGRLQLVRENELLQKLCRQMEERISEQVLLIALLKESRENSPKYNPPKVKAMLPPSDPVENKRAKSGTAEENITDKTARKRSEIPAVKKNNFIRGSSEIPAVPIGTTKSTFAAVARRAYFYVGNINPQTGKEEVLHYIKSKRPNDDFVLEELPMRDGAVSRAFKLITDYELIEVINKPDFWPQGVIVKKFFRIAKKQGTRSQQ